MQKKTAEKRAMGGYVACNAKYFKASQIKGLMAHIRRLFEHDENVFPELSGENFGHEFATYEQLERQMLDAKKAAGLRARGFQKDANVMVDNILILNRSIVNELKRTNPDGYKDDLKKAAIALSERIKNEFGLEPMYIDFHFDEGHKDEKTGEFLNNYHAHMGFLNFDFNKLNQPLRGMKRGAFSKFQDFAAEEFAHLGFQRGESKKITGNKHLDKKAFLIQKLKDEINSLDDSFEKQKLGHELDLMQMRYEKDKANQELSLAIKELENIKVEIESGRKMMPKLMQAKQLALSLQSNENRFKRFLELEGNERMHLELKTLQKRLEELGEHSQTNIKREVDSFIENTLNFFKKT